MMDTRTDRARRLYGLAWLIVALATLLSHAHSLVEMASIWWRSGTYAHAFLVPPIAAWLAWRQRTALNSAPFKAEPVWLIPMAICAGLALLGSLAHSNVVPQFAAVALFVMTVPLVLGHAAARVLAFPLGFLFFCPPIGDFLIPTLIDHTADFTVLALQLSGIPVYREENRLVIPTGYWSVVEACSGVRYLIASLMVGVLYAHLSFRSWRYRLGFVALSIATPLVANWLRAYGIVLLGHLSDNRIATGVDHLVYGWLFFGIVMMVMFAIGRCWVEPAARRSPPAGNEPAPRWGWSSGLTVVGALLVICTPAGVERLALRQSQVSPLPALDPSIETALNHQSAGDADDLWGWYPPARGASFEWRGIGHLPSGPVGLYLAYYRTQDKERRLIPADDPLVPPSEKHWRRIPDAQVAPLELDGRQVLPSASTLRRVALTAADSSATLRVWQLYRVDGTWTADPIAARLRTAWQRLNGRGDSALSVTLFASGHAQAADRDLAAALQQHAVAMARSLEVPPSAARP